MKTPRFNLALLFPDGDINDIIYDNSLKIKHLSSDYCVERGRSLPHVTLCQFRAENARSAFQRAKGFLKKEIEIEIDGLYFKKKLKNKPNNKNDNIALGFSLRKTPDLICLQSDIFFYLKESKESGVEVLTATGSDYFPHITLAKIPFLSISDLEKRQFFSEDLLPVLFAEECLNGVRGRVSLGFCDEAGQFIRQIEEENG